MQYFRKQNESDICGISWYPLCIGIKIDNFCQIHIATWYLCTLWCACSKLKVSYIMGYNPTDRTEKLIHNLGLQWQSRTNWSIAKCRHQTVLTVSIFYWFNIQRNLFTAVTQSSFCSRKMENVCINGCVLLFDMPAKNVIKVVTFISIQLHTLSREVFPIWWRSNPSFHQTSFSAPDWRHAVGNTFITLIA